MEAAENIFSVFLGGVVVPITTSTSAVLRRVEVLSHVHNILWSIFKKLQLPEYFNLNPHFVTMAGWLLAALREEKKNSGEITVQAASKSWLLYTVQEPWECSCNQWSQGEWSALPSYSRAFIGEIDDEDITFDQVRHSLSSQKRKRKQKYSLTAVVQSCYILPNLLDGANINSACLLIFREVKVTV